MVKGMKTIIAYTATADRLASGVVVEDYERTNAVRMSVANVQVRNAVGRNICV
jgi:hypothetical protein